jgi:hypothetical protein
MKGNKERNMSKQLACRITVWLLFAVVALPGLTLPAFAADATRPAIERESIWGALKGNLPKALIGKNGDGNVFSTLANIRTEESFQLATIRRGWIRPVPPPARFDDGG